MFNELFNVCGFRDENPGNKQETIWLQWPDVLVINMY